MSESNKSYRIRTVVGQDTNLTVNLDQSYDVFEVLSIKLKQEDTYRLHASNYGVIVGRVLANEGFGVPNAKVSVFIKGEYDASSNTDIAAIYPYQTTSSQGMDGVQYNLLPDNQVDDCHQVVGTFPNKTYMLDNDALIEVFDEYYKYTTRTNNSGDYIICGVPVGQQTLHMDLDLSDCGILSQRPRDFVYKGYTIEQFENPNQFKTGTDLNSLSQIFRQDTVVNVIPFWGNEELGESIGITRADIKVNFKFEPTCVFMGSLVADNSSNGVSKKCIPTNQMGAMDELTTGEGTIEMIRKTPNGDVEEFQIKGTQLIDGNGVWCYQIPMNLDYMMTDEYGNMVPTDDPTKGIPTRARVRFRISMHDTEKNTDNYFRAKVLVPHNPQNYFSGETLMHEDYDYEFGTYTKEESFRDLFWNNVYTVKSYIPRFQKSKKSNTERFTGIKHCNIYGQNNPMPYNNIRIKMPFMFILLCALIKTYVRIVYFVNGLTDYFVEVLARLSRMKLLSWDDRKKFEDKALDTKFTLIADGICPDLDNWYFSPTFSRVKHHTKGTQKRGLTAYDKYFTTLDRTFQYLITNPDEEKTTSDKTSIDNGNKSEGEDSVCLTINTDYLMSCIEMNLAQEYKVINFDFYNDWVNGVIYMPRWMRSVRKKRTFLFGLIKIRPKVKSCADDSSIFGKTRYYTQQCALTYGKTQGKFTKITTHNGCMNRTNANKQKCHKLKGLKTYSIFGSGSRKGDKGNGGVVHESQTMKNQYVYYFKPCEWRTSTGKKTILFANDLVLLGSLNDCNLYGIPQAFRYLTNSSYVMPTNLALTNMDDDGYLYADDSGTICSGHKNINENSDRGGVNQVEPSFENEQKYWGPSAEEDVSYGTNGNDDVDTLNYDDTIPLTEAAGIAWNYSGPGQGKNSTNVTKKLYYPGGHFLGISCTNSQTNIKSCVNLQRICEIGATESQRREEVREVSHNGILYRYYVPTGLIAQDEVNASDFRSMFATMNHRRLLCTNKFDEKTGYPIYNFTYMRPIGFDGVLMDRVSKASEYNTNVDVNDESQFMKTQGVSMSDDYDSSEQRETKTRTIEEPSDDYYMFRLGLNTLGDEEQKSKFLYSQSSSVSMPQYENSYYFYFGLKDGATALDEFNKQFFSVCDSKSVFMTSPVILTGETFDSCTFDLSLTVTVENMDAPVSVTIKNRNSEQTVLTQETTGNPAVCIFKNLTRGAYEITATDNDGKIVTTTVQVGGSSISMETSTKDFEFKTRDISNPEYIIESGKTLNCGYIRVGDSVTLYGDEVEKITINDGVVLVLVDKDLNYVTSNGNGISKTAREQIAKTLGIDEIGEYLGYSSFENGKFYAWISDASYDLFILRNCGGSDNIAYYGTFVINGCDNYDIYLGSKYLSYSEDLYPLSKRYGVLNWFEHINISGTNKKEWAMRHYLFRQTDNDDETFKNNIIALNNNGREIDTVLFGQPDYLDEDNHYRYDGGTSYYEGDSEYFKGDLSDDSIIPTWPSKYVQEYYAKSGQGPKLHYGEMATYNGIIASDKIGAYYVNFSQDGDRIKISGITAASNVVPNHYGCVVRLEDDTIVYPVRDGDSYYYYGDMPENREQLVSVYPVLYYPVMYRPFYAKQYVFDWINGRIDTEIEDNKEIAIPLFDCESWKSQLDIYNGITYNGKFSNSGTTVNGVEEAIEVNSNDLAIVASIDDGCANVRTFISSAITNSNSASGYTVDSFGFNIIEGSPYLTDEEKNKLNSPYSLELASIEGNTSNDFPSYIGYKFDKTKEIMFISDNDSANVTFYLQTGSTDCPLVKDKAVYRDADGLFTGDYILCRYNEIANQLSSKNTVGKEVIVNLTANIAGVRVASFAYYEHNAETGNDTELTKTLIINGGFPYDLKKYEEAVRRLKEAGVDVVYSYKLKNSRFDVESFVTKIESNSNFIKIENMKESIKNINAFNDNYYVVAIKKEKSGEKGEVNVVRVYPHDSIQQIQKYTPPSEPYIEVVPSGTTGVYGSVSENSGTTFISDGGTLQIRVKSSTSWAFNFESEGGNTSWIKVNGASSYNGQGVEYLTITATPNESDTEDKIVSGIAKTNVTHIDGEGQPVPYSNYVIFKLLRKERKNYIEPDTVTTFSNGGGSLGIKIISNTTENWKLTLVNESEENWVKFSTTDNTFITGNGNTTVYLMANENRTQGERRCHVELDNAVGGDGRLDFKQDSTQVELVVSPLSLEFDKTGGTKYIAVTCNGAWVSSKSGGATWIDLTDGSDRIRVLAGPNDSISRDAVITVTSNGVSKTVNVYQSDGTNKFINTSFSTTSVTSEERKDIVITVRSNTSWRLTKDSSATWFKFPNNLDYCSGIGDGSIMCSVDLNRGDDRTCVIQTKATALDCIPEPETTTFLQVASDYSFILVNNTSSEYIIEGITFTTNRETLSYDEIYIWNGGRKELRMFYDEYTCTQVSVSIIGDIQNLSQISFMGNILSKNEYGKYSGYVNNLSLRNNETYTLEKA